MDIADDLLSELPECIIESILTRMPILDAVQTSLLSSKWRYKWTKIPILVFDQNMVCSFKKTPMSIYLKPDSCICLIGWKGIAKFITHTLFLHDGPIDKFKISVTVSCYWPDIDHWILYLLRNRGVKELILAISNHGYWHTSSCLFKLESLTHLELHHCKVEPPSDFQGFSFLKILTLYDIGGPPEPIEFLISQCPLLETLSLSCSYSWKLHIDAPRLKCMTLNGEFDDIILATTPLLLSVDITMLLFFDEDDIKHRELNNQSTFDKFLGAVPLLEKLVGNVFFLKYLSVGHEFARIPITCKHLTVMELSCISFENIDEMNVVVRLLVSSPVLHTLKVSVFPLDELDSESESGSGSGSLTVVNWDKDSFPKSNLEHLRQVKLANMLGNPNEFIFVEFLLKVSPVLKTLEISTSTSLESAERDKVLVELLSFQRVSALAKITVLQP